MSIPTYIYIAFGDIAAHHGAVAGPYASDDLSWTYQNIQPWVYCSSILYEGPSSDEAQAVLDAWLICDSVENNEYCYTHNPDPRRE